VLKFNVDARSDIDTPKGNTGGVARNHKGQFIAACNSIDYVHDALSAEAQKTKQGLQLAKSLGCNRIIINSDNHEVDKVKPKPGFHVKRNGFIRIKKQGLCFRT
jgi:hypothetical protein